MDAALFRACARFPLNDVGNGARFKAYFGARAMWLPREGWAVRLRGVWARDHDEAEVRRMAQLVPTLMVEEAVHLAPGGDLALRREAYLRFAVASGESCRIANMLREASVNLVGSIGRCRYGGARRPAMPEGVRHGYV